MAKPAPKTASKFDPSKVEVVKELITPTLKVGPGDTVFVTVTAPMYVGREIAEKDRPKGEAKRGPATLIPVKVICDGKDGTLDGANAVIVGNKLLVGALTEGYPGDKYIGKSFRITKSSEKKKGGNGEYYTFNVDEIKA